MGTAILVFIGCGSIAQVVLGSAVTADFGGFLCVALGWGIAVYMGVLFSGKSGRGHINPAVSVAFALIGKLDYKRLVLYVLAQYLGAFVGALILYLIYMEQIWSFHLLKLPASNATEVDWLTLSGIFSTFPNANWHTCFIDQIIGTALLMAGVLAIVDKRNFNIPDWAQPLHVMFLLVGLVLTLGLNAGAALNPARDLAPRILIAIAYSGKHAFAGRNFYFWIPIVGPHIGAILGAIIYKVTVGLHLPKENSLKSTSEQDCPYKEDDFTALKSVDKIPHTHAGDI